MELSVWSLGCLALARGVWLVGVRSPAASGWMALAALGAFALGTRVPATLGQLGVFLVLLAGSASVGLVLIAGALGREADTRRATADLAEANHLEREVRVLRRRRTLRARRSSSRFLGSAAADPVGRRVA